jgi:acetyltransferase-like isoleucine patch superfamily enzyme
MIKSHGSGQEWCVLGKSSHGNHAQILAETFKSIGKECAIESTVLIFHPYKVSLGNEVYIGHHSILKGYHKSDGEITIGNRAWIGENVYIHGAGGVTIEEQVTIAPGVKIISSHNEYEGNSENLRESPIVLNEVRICMGASIGLGSIIYPGVHVGKDAYVCPGSVVVQDVFPFDIVAGNPAKVIGLRGKNNTNWLDAFK